MSHCLAKSPSSGLLAEDALQGAPFNLLPQLFPCARA